MGRQKAIQASEHTCNVLLQPEPEGGYTVTCPSLPGLVTYGETSRGSPGHGGRGDRSLSREPADRR